MLYQAIISQAVSENRQTLDESEAKRVLQSFDIPIVQEKKVTSIDDALTYANQLGYPVYIKAIGNTLTHKTEHQLVFGNIHNENQVRSAISNIQDKALDAVEGYLIQSQINGKRELTAGLFQDPLFGTVVMFGIGGIFAEALDDVVFRLTPLTHADAVEMIDSIHGQKLLHEFRGEASVNRESLVQILMGLSRLAETVPEIAEVDINPFVVQPDGNLIAVDALIVLSREKETQHHTKPISSKQLGTMFYPKSIAFVGASQQMGKWGHILLTNTISGGYKGKIYLVNPKGGEIAGKKVYQTINDIPDPFDLAVITIPAKHVIDLIPQLKEKQVKGMLVITSGFREIGEEGHEMERQLIAAANNAGILILGPNTMGISNPHFQFYCTNAHVHPKPGGTVLVSQSGNMGTQLMAFAEQQGLGMRAFSGSGNEAMTTIEDYMEAFEQDNLTQSVILYLESIKNGRRFFKSARRVSPKKPIVVLKGGRTQAGGKAAQSHTGALATNARIFNAACQQAGIILVKKPMDLLDLSTVFSALPLPKGNRVAIMTIGGGWGVVTADLCSEYGIQLPALSESIIEKFNTMLPSYWSRANPLDLVGEVKPDLAFVGLETLLQWDGCDAVIHLGIHGKDLYVKRLTQSVRQVDPHFTQEFLDNVNTQNQSYEQQYIEHVIQLTEKYQKPVLGVSLLTSPDDHTLYSIPDHKYKCVMFPSPERAVFALSRMCRYADWCRRHVDG